MGRYRVDSGGRVICNVGITIGSTATLGTSTTEVYIVELPLPANRWAGQIDGTSGADLPIGTGLAWMGAAANPSLVVPLTPTLADSMQGYNIGSNEDYFAHLFVPYSLAMGTGQVFGSGGTVVTVTHNLGFIPAAYDIELVPTNIASTNPKDFYPANITATTFDATIGASSTTTPLAFNWKIRAESNTSAGFTMLANPFRPFAWAAGCKLSLRLDYEARF